VGWAGQKMGMPDRRNEVVLGACLALAVGCAGHVSSPVRWWDSGHLWESSPHARHKEAVGVRPAVECGATGGPANCDGAGFTVQWRSDRLEPSR
jgi:hypothetical protein